MMPPKVHGFGYAERYAAMRDAVAAAIQCPIVDTDEPEPLAETGQEPDPEAAPE